MDFGGTVNHQWTREEPHMEHMKLLLRPTETAIALGCSRSKVYELMHKGVIPFVLIDGLRRVPAIQLQACIDALIREQAEGR
jgi:excisionase family DNA binding protein